MMKNIVISLKSAEKRRQHITNEFGKQNIPFEFFDAITPDLVQPIGKEIGIDFSQNQSLTPREQACFVSHIALWQKMIDENIDYLAIFEDDIYLGKNAHLFLTGGGWFAEFELIKLEVMYKHQLSDKKYRTLNGRWLYRLQTIHTGTAGYIISQKMVIELLKYIKKQPIQDLEAIDIIMFGNYLHTENAIPVYQLLPALVVQYDFCKEFINSNDSFLYSQIQPERALKPQQHIEPEVMIKPKLPIGKKIIREIVRPFLQLYSPIREYREKRRWFR